MGNYHNVRVTCKIRSPHMYDSIRTNIHAGCIVKMGGAKSNVR